MFSVSKVRGTRSSLQCEKVCKLSLGQSHSIHPIDWRFDHPSAPWWADFGSVLLGLSKTFGSECWFGLVSTMKSCELFVVIVKLFQNCRPLTYISENIDDLVFITPAMPLEKIGDIVLLEQDNKNRINWPLARVIELFPRKEGIDRVVKVRNNGPGEIIRPMQRLFHLEIPVEERSHK
ncbi:unnamed protein product [Allacma fusca]|uniref:DUF5641 domain-containing protein n=1 Tax=Allacma fusca TaxID=39272 RepID=A0A8J2Q0W0_9HEXA|nr:unnamed protein product [Allacma fusca]